MMSSVESRRASHAESSPCGNREPLAVLEQGRDQGISGPGEPNASKPPGGCVQVFSATEGRIRIEQRPDYSSFVIESAERVDEGRYTIKVTNPVGEDMASIFLRVVGEQRAEGTKTWGDSRRSPGAT
jgi:hypothetical protein